MIVAETWLTKQMIVVTQSPRGLYKACELDAREAKVRATNSYFVANKYDCLSLRQLCKEDPLIRVSGAATGRRKTLQSALGLVCSPQGVRTRQNEAKSFSDYADKPLKGSRKASLWGNP